MKDPNALPPDLRDALRAFLIADYEADRLDIAQQSDEASYDEFSNAMEVRSAALRHMIDVAEDYLSGTITPEERP